jgi:hypothetical protein
MGSSTATSRRGGDDDRERSDPLGEAYFHWLVEQVREEGHQRKTYWDLLKIMHTAEFVWLVPNDDNRISDGLDLRTEFLNEQEERESTVDGPCSVLEVMVGLSRRVAFLAGGNAEGWAWQLMCNLELHKHHDPLRRPRTVTQILHALVWRLYDPDGSGGFFPLGFPKQDQRKVEIWYQMAEYVQEIHPEY